MGTNEGVGLDYAQNVDTERHLQSPRAMLSASNLQSSVALNFAGLKRSITHSYPFIDRKAGPGPPRNSGAGSFGLAQP